MVTNVTSTSGASIVNALTNSSVDISALATNLVEATRAPQQALLDAQKTAATNKISSIGRIYSAATDMKTAMAAFGDPATLAFQPASSDPTKARFAFRPYYTPQALDFSFQVKQLASANLVTLAGVSNSAPAMSGTLTIGKGQRDAGGAIVAQYDLAHYASLDALRDAINAGGSFQATIMNSVTPSGLTRYLSIGGGTGEANRFFVTTTDAAGADLATGLHVTPPTRDATTGAILSDPGQANGQDAQIVSGGVTYASASNRFSKLVDGVDIDVSSVTPEGQSVRLSTQRDVETYKRVVRDAVKTYNDLLTTIRGEIAYDADVAKRGGLSNDPTTRAFLAQMRRVTTEPISGALPRPVTLAEAGVKTTLDGSLSIDETALSALANRSPEVLEAIVASTAHSTGLLARMNKLQSAVLSTNSDFVKLYDRTNKVELARVDGKIADLGAQMDALKTRYLKQFTAMQAVLSQSKASQDSLTNHMSAWSAGLKG